MTLRTKIIVAAMAAGLAGPAAAQGDAAAGERVFAKCRACHQAGPDAANRVGPALTHVVGHEIASAEGFNYSDAFLAKKAEGFIWTEENLAEYLANPRAAIPGNKMAFPGLRNETELADMIAYLASFQ